MLIELTDQAIVAVKQAMELERLPVAGTFLRVGVRKGGCSGHSYTLAFETASREDDRVVEKDGVRLLVDPGSEIYVAGMTLDYKRGLTEQGFLFQNPNAKGSCHCGSSFKA
jgi:iron-sulfur cluster assembly accessory protein